MKNEDDGIMELEEAHSYLKVIMVIGNPHFWHLYILSDPLIIMFYNDLYLQSSAISSTCNVLQ